MVAVLIASSCVGEDPEPAADESVVVTSVTVDVPDVTEVDEPVATYAVGGPRTYVVHPDASGGDGSPDAPFGDLTTALGALRPGDTLRLHGGVYRQRVRVTVTPATQREPITVEPMPGERPVVEGLLWIEGASYWTFRGVNVTWSSKNDDDEHMVKFSGGTGWEFTDAEVWGARSYAAILVAGDAADFRLARLFVHDTYESNGANQDHLIYLNSGDGGGVVEQSLLVRSENGRAIKIGGADDDDPDVRNIVIRYNTMVDNQGPSNIQLSYDSSDIRIERNIFVRPRARSAAVTGFRFDGDGVEVVDNIYWQASTVVEEEMSDRVEVRGNRRVDPKFLDERNDDFRPGNPAAQAYGATTSDLSPVSRDG